MGRVSRALLVVVILAVAAPATGASSRKTVGCAGALSSGSTASCTTHVRIAHFDTRDRIDYGTLVARVVSPQATSWRVSGTISDARGIAYFAWTCSASRSSVAMGNQTYVERSCEATRRTVRAKNSRGQWHREYYVADTSKPQRVSVSAQVGMCTPSCRFEASAQYVFAR